jgi:hypothetical protein
MVTSHKTSRKPSHPRHVNAPASEERPPVAILVEEPVTLDLVDTSSPSPPASSAPTSSSHPEMQWSQVELGPSLPMAVFTSIEIWNSERIGALALYCSDGRWGEAFDEFCHKHRHLPRYDRLAVPGGPGWLVPASGADHLYQAAHEQLSLLVQVHELKRILLITHYGCAFYRERLGKDADGCIPAQMADVEMAAETLRLWFPDVEVETYLAMRRGNCLSFHEVSPSPQSISREEKADGKH